MKHRGHIPLFQAFPGCLGLLGICLVLVSTSPRAEDLLSIYQLAEQKDPAYLSVIASRRAIAEEVPQARAQLVLPEITLSGNATYNQQYISTDSLLRGGSTNFYSRGYSLNLNQPVYHYDRWRRLRQARLDVRKAQAEQDAALQDLIVRVAVAYFGVLAAHDELEFAQSEKKAFARQLEQTTQRFDVGLIAITDVEESRSAYDASVARVIAAENQLDIAHEKLREITGRYHRQLTPLGEHMPLVNPEPSDISAWTRIALKQNLKLAAASYAVEAAREEVKRQNAGHLPTLDLVGSNSFSHSGGLFGSNDITSYALGLQLNVPIYQGGQVISRTRQAGHRLAEAQEKQELQRRAADRETRSSYLSVVSGISQVQALAQSVKSNATALQATEAGFEVGTRTTVDVTIAQRSLFQAKRDLAQARYDYILNSLRLKAAAGTLAPTDLQQVNGWLQ